MQRFLIPLLLAGLIVGCGPNKRENVEAPAELEKLTPTINVDRVWERSIGKGERRLGARMGPAVDSGQVYVADPRGELFAFDGASGREIWKIDTGLRLSGGPGVGEGTLVVGTLDGEVVAYNPDSGSERWRAQVSSEVITAPAIARGQVVVRSIDGRVFAFSIIDGERRWVHDRGIPALTLRGNSTPVLAEGLVLLGYDSGHIVALRGDDGVQLWEQTIALGEGRSELERMVDIDGAMAYEQGELYAAAFNAQVVALSLEGGRSLWNREMSSYGGLVLDGERILVADRDSVIWALDRRTGSALWKQDMLTYRWLSGPAIHGRNVVFGDLEGHLHWFDLETGQPAARVRLDKRPIRSIPEVADGLLFVLSSGGQLGAYRIN